MRHGRTLMAAVAALLAGACTSDAGNDAQPGSNTPPTGIPASAPPSAEAVRAEGDYQLSSINDNSLPAVVRETDGCHVEVVDGSLQLLSGRFAFQNRVREVCGTDDPASEPVMHAAGGRYRVDGDDIVLETEVGDAFTEARGTIDTDGVTIRELTSDAGMTVAVWEMVRDSL